MKTRAAVSMFCLVEIKKAKRGFFLNHRTVLMSGNQVRSFQVASLKHSGTKRNS